MAALTAAQATKAVAELLKLDHIKANLTATGGASFIDSLADGDHTLVPTVDMDALKSPENSQGKPRKVVTLRFDGNLFVALGAFTKDEKQATKLLETYLMGSKSITVTIAKGRITKFAY